MREVRASGLDALALATRLLQRARLAHPTAGLWEAADVQWWWRTPRASDELEQVFWVDEHGPVAAVLATEFRGRWQIDPLSAVPAHAQPAHERALDLIESFGDVVIGVRDDDRDLRALVEAAGLVPVETGGVTWMDAQDRPSAALPDGFVLVDRRDAHGPHPMRARNGEGVEERLRECSLYDPTLDLAVETDDGQVAGYSLWWFDPVTRIGLLEPMRVEDAFQRRGLARAMIAEGLQRLSARGAERMKVGFATEAARALYTGAGYRVEATDTWFGTPAK